ncbi:hypothetical protein [Streptomyces apricus]|uniref:hypothetical protein n=1 Tax=Streptomyces apricus TaxID=1828112 RepID=UPI00165EE583|nr:hypothetical protein [Streptomyces apricus]
MAVEQLPGQVREFAQYFGGLLSRLDQGGGWCGVFWQRDPDGMRACLDGTEVPPWDVVQAVLQDLAAEYGDPAAAQETERARALHGVALTAYDARPGGRDALGDRLDVMLREQRYAAERLAELGRALGAATSRAETDALELDLAWARDDHDRATARCAELRTRMDELDRRTVGGHAQETLAIPRITHAADEVVWIDEPGEDRPVAGPGGVAGDGEGDEVRWSGGDGGGDQARWSGGDGGADEASWSGGADGADGGDEARWSRGADGSGEGDQARWSGRADGDDGARRPGGRGPVPVAAPHGDVRRPAPDEDDWPAPRHDIAPDRAAPGAPAPDPTPGPASGPGRASGLGQVPGQASGPAAGSGTDPVTGADPAFGSASGLTPGSGSVFDPGPPFGPGPDLASGPVSSPTFDTGAGSGSAFGSGAGPDPRAAFGSGTGPGDGSEGGFGGDGVSGGESVFDKGRAFDEGLAPYAGPAPHDTAPPEAVAPHPEGHPEEEPPASKQRPRRRIRGRVRGSARFAGEIDPATAPDGGAGSPVAPSPAQEKPRREALDDEARRATVETVTHLVRLRGEGRTGEAHAVLVEAAYWPAARLPLLAAELHRAGLGADWATLLWEAVSLPADRLVAAADALAAAGRTADGEQMLRQGVARPAPEIGEAVLGLVRADRHREARALVDAYVRTRAPEEAARSVDADPKLLAPLLLEAARGVSEQRHWDLVHALRVAGHTA